MTSDLYQEPQIGDRVMARVVEVGEREMLLDIGAKQEALMLRRDFGREGKRAQVNDEFEVLVIDRDQETGQFLVSRRRIEEENLWNDLERWRDSGEAVEVQVVRQTKGGWLVDLGIIRGFLPRSQMDLKPVEKPDEWVGKTIQVQIVELDPEERRVVVSRRRLLEREIARQKEEAFQRIQVGQKYVGKVQKLMDYGAFVDLGGVTGLLHVSELAHQRVRRPAEILQEGQEIEVLVIGKDEERRRIQLSRKRLLRDPWEEFVARHAPGDVVEGKVVSIRSFGVFVELAEGVQGLLHRSEISALEEVKPEERFQVGQKIRVRILQMNAQKRSARLSTKGLLDDSVEEKYLIQGGETGVRLGDILDLSSSESEES